MIKDKLIILIKETINLEGEDIAIDESTNLTNDLNFSSLDFIKLVVKIENEFNIEFDDDFLDFNKFNVFGNLEIYIGTLVEGDWLYES